MQAINLLITGRASQSLAPASGVDVARLQDVQAVFAGAAPLAHTHVTAQISDFTAGLLAALAAAGVPLSGVPVALATVSGLIYDVLGLRVNSGVVSLVGHAHTTADLTNFNGAVLAQTTATLGNTSSLTWSPAGGQLFGAVALTSGGGLLRMGDGLRADSGVVSFVGHTHAQLHNPVTLGTGATVALALAGQQLSAEAVLQPAGGLVATPSGVGVDFGSGHNQVLRGDVVLTASTLTTANSPTLRLGIAGGVASGVVPLDPSPAAGYGKLAVGLNGVVTVLGTDAQSAAAGNHTHAAATPLVNGFLSTTDKTRLDTLWATPPPSGVTYTLATPSLQLGLTGNVASGVVQLDPTPATNYGALSCSASGLRVNLGTTSGTAAAGNHTHAGTYVPLAGGQMAGVLTLLGALTVSGVSMTAPVSPSGVAVWFAATVNGVAYKIRLYQ